MTRSALRFGFGTASLLAGGWVLRALHGAPLALGAMPAEINAVAKRSPNFRDGVFVNAEPAATISLDSEQRRLLARELLTGRGSGRPGAPIPVVTPTPAEAAATAELAVSWYGHSTALIEVDGYRVLADPIWSRRCSPSHTVGPERMHDVPVPLEGLPAVDAVVISHDHYDHLDIDTVIALARTQRAPFFVPLGVGAHLRKWGIPEDRIVELDWNESHRLGDLTVVCTPARHFSGRLFARNTTLWASWVIVGPRHRAFFGGDTGYTKSFADIGAEHGPFDLTLLPIGAYHPAWPDIHMNPEEAVRAHLDIAEAASGLLVPIHWATFRLAPHPWAEPVQRLLAAAEPESLTVAVPRPGQRVAKDGSPVTDPWWQR
jgi:L-ascorbate metabolism protein UlaG (beta-lactamase superfamily)